MTKFWVKDANRFKKRRLKDSLWKDILRYLAELVTNSDDSYKRLEKKWETVDWRIIIMLKKVIINRKKEYEISVTDFAEWMSRETMIKIFTKYWNDNAWWIEWHVRWIFWQWASDVLRNACSDQKTAIVESIHNWMYTRLIYKDDWEYDYSIDIWDSEPVTEVKRWQLMISWNGTKITFWIPSNVEFGPQIRENLEESISKYPTFRYLLDKKFSERKICYTNWSIVKIKELDSSKYRLEWETIYDDDFKFKYLDKEVNCHLKLFENINETDDETKIIVRDENYTVFANTPFDFSYIKWLKWELVINGLYKICYEELNSENPEAIFKDNRTWFDTTKTFYKELNKTLHPIISWTADKNKDTIILTENKEFKNGLSALNKYAKDILHEDMIWWWNETGETPPATWIQFIRSDITITKWKKYGLRLLINPKIINENDSINITIDENNENIEISPNIIKYNKEEINENWIVKKSITIIANEITENPVYIKAKCWEYEDNAYIIVSELDIHYPENWLEFYPNEVNLVYNKEHVVKLYFDSNIIPLWEKITIKTWWLIWETTYETNNSQIITNSIWVIEVWLNWWELWMTYKVVAEYNNIETSTEITLIEEKEEKSPTNWFISDFKLRDYPIPDFQAYLEPNTWIVRINTSNPINKYMLGDLKNLKIKNQKYTKEQNKFICDIITNVAARELVKRKNVAHWEVNFDELQELAIDQIRDFFQKYKNEMFKILFWHIVKNNWD